MKNRFTGFLLVVTVILFAIGCEKEPQMPAKDNFGTRFFPLEVGNYRVYQVEEISYSLVKENDTAIYQLKETVAGFYLNQQDDTTFILSRHKRQAENEDWTVDSIWAARAANGQIIITQNNVPFVALAYPVTEGLTWDGNALNTLEVDQYEVKSLHVPFKTEIEKFENTLTVIENNNPDSVIFHDYRKVVYAAGVGLIYREEKILHYCATTVACLGKGIIESGRKYKQRIIGYGNE